MYGVKPCPFCNRNYQSVKTIEEWEEDVGIYQVSCGYCGARGPAELSKERAIKSWNDIYFKFDKSAIEPVCERIRHDVCLDAISHQLNQFVEKSSAPASNTTSSGPSAS